MRSNDGEGKPGRKEPLRSDRQAFCQSDTIAVSELFGSGLALSVSSQAPRQLPQRGSHWHVGQLSSGRAKHNISGAAVLRCLGQRQLDKERCPEAAVPVSKARPFAPYRASGVQHRPDRPAKASPFGRGGTEGDGEGKPGRKEPLRSDGQALCQSDTIAVPELFVSGLALSVGLAPAKAGLRLPASASLPLASCWPRPQQLLPVSATGGGRRRCPKGGALGMSVSFRLDEQSTISRKQQCSAVQASDSLTRSVVQKPLSP